MIYKTYAKARQTLGTFTDEGSSLCWYGITSRDRIGADLPLNVSLGPRSRRGEIERAEYTTAYPAHGKQVGLGSLRSGDFLMNAAGI